MPVRRFVASLAVLFIACLTGGCAGTRLPASGPPDSLDDVNYLLADRWATIERTDGTTAEFTEDVRIGPETTTYYDRRDRERRSMPTADVRLVTVQEKSRTGRGLLIGAVPGLSMIGALLLSPPNPNSEGNVAFAEELARAYARIGGAVLAVAGGIVGAAIGANMGGEVGIAYRGPVERYLAAPGEPQRPPPR